MPPKLLIDLNIVLDVLQQREPHYEQSAAVLDLIARQQATGLLAAHSITTLHYLLTRYRNHEVAAVALTELLTVFQVAAVTDAVIRKAVAWGWRDFEDAVQMAAAVAEGANYLVTRNPKDYAAQLIPVVEPARLLALFGGS
ncbi:MAG: PIN domain-containing protein [Ardenticatenaceae bacterium]|nr:PIN domain-containing protein [Ardenticatenaceae bacterium]